MTGCEIMRCRHYNKDKDICECRDDTCVYNTVEADEDYDTLKAKAELFDEAVESLKAFFLPHSDLTGLTEHPWVGSKSWEKANTILSKAKGL